MKPLIAASDWEGARRRMNRKSGDLPTAPRPTAFGEKRLGVRTVLPRPDTRLFALGRTNARVWCVKEDEMARTNTTMLLLLALALTLGGCGDDDGPDAGDDSGADAGADAGDDGGLDDGGDDAGPDAGDDGGAEDGGPPVATCDEGALEHFGVVTTSADFTEAEFTAMRIADWTAPSPTALMDTDTVLAQSACQGYVLERGRGVLDVVDAEMAPTIAHSIDLNPAGTAVPYAINQQQVTSVGPSRAYVVEFARNSLTIIDPSIDGPGAMLGTIDLSPYVKAGDTDGLVDAADAIVVGDRAYVALGHYWFDDMYAIHFEGSELAVIDTTTDTLVDVDTATDGVQGIALSGDNPWRGLHHFPGTDTLWVGATGDSFAIDGHIEEVDLAAAASVGTVVTEAELGGEIEAFDVLSPTRLVLLVGEDVVAIDPTVDFIAPTPFATEMDGMFVYGGTVWAWARTGEAPGLASFDGVTGAETTPASGRANFGSLPISSVMPIP